MTCGGNTLKYCTQIHSPIGTISLLANEKHLTHILFKKRLTPTPKSSRPLRIAKKQLEEYFSGKRTKFSIPLQIEGTQFQKTVWQALGGIAYGKTKSYADLAKTIGREKAMRAVGNAMGRNNFPIVLPCHRVIRSQGTLGGFTGGTSIKRWLLNFEKQKSATS